VPKLAKSTKTARDLGVIRGARKHFTIRKAIIINEVRYTADSLAAVFEEHLQAMARVHQLTLERSKAIAAERELEAKVARIYIGVKNIAESMMGKHGARMRDFGIEPDKKPRMTAETKLLANVKRQATRKRRGIMGKKQRSKLSDDGRHG